MRIATWNVNSIRSRFARVVDWLVSEDVDVLGMQEIKCKPEQFPVEAFEAAGYEVVAHGLDQWNGVAFASRVPMTDVETNFTGQPGFKKGFEGSEAPLEARALAVTVEGIRLWSLYVPNGRGLDDPHMAYKLNWLDQLASQTSKWLNESPDQILALMGDWNIAPSDADMGDPSFIQGESTHISPKERAAFHEFLDIGMVDVVRSFVPTGYTYWDYKQLKFPKNEGMRIDFILGSKALADICIDAKIHRDERKGDAPSDHVPVSIDIDTGEAELDRPMIF
ncbi:MAG: exodeoxyribonuclease III [Microbacteriaceae bacterium]|nr:exodeoxyribonuclease III [Cryobacterium sp.]MBX3103621.1 exodeoxyribonuclease III [Cryobacterium sp.]MCC6376935.1 exodeoxyribonuclease III [Microbacteriaceae bacterium]